MVFAHVVNWYEGRIYKAAADGPGINAASYLSLIVILTLPRRLLSQLLPAIISIIRRI